jgi:hypothetical protein
MDAERQALFETMRDQLTPRLDRLDQDFLELPSLIMDAAEMATDALIENRRLDVNYDRIRAEEADRLRTDLMPGEKKPTEDSIKGNVINMPRVIEAANLSEQARTDLARWQNLLRGMEAKQTAMKQLCAMTLAGYAGAGAGSFTPSVDQIKSRLAAGRPRLNAGAK